MEEVKKLIEKGIRRSIALIVYWYKLTQAEKESLDFKTLTEVWESIPDSAEKNEVLSLLKKAAKSSNEYIFLLEHTFVNERLYFSILEKKAKSFNQKIWIWKNFDKYSERESEAQKNEIWNELKAKVKTLKQAVKLWTATEQHSPEEKEALAVIKEYAKEFSDCKYILDDVFCSSMSEWDEIFLLAKEKAVSFDDYLTLWYHETDPEKEEELWNSLWEKAETPEQAIDLFLYSNNDEAAQRLIQVRAKL